jgi:hypothetical protein
MTWPLLTSYSKRSKKEVPSAGYIYTRITNKKPHREYSVGLLLLVPILFYSLTRATHVASRATAIFAHPAPNG